MWHWQRRKVLAFIKNVVQDLGQWYKAVHGTVGGPQGPNMAVVFASCEAPASQQKAYHSAIVKPEAYRSLQWVWDALVLC